MSNGTIQPAALSAQRRLNDWRVLAIVRIASARRSELESMCELTGIAHQGRSSLTLRQALRQRMLVAPTTRNYRGDVRGSMPDLRNSE